MLQVSVLVKVDKYSWPLEHWRWRQHGLRNVGFQPPTKLHGATTQKPRISIFTSVNTSVHTQEHFCVIESHWYEMLILFKWLQNYVKFNRLNVATTNYHTRVKRQNTRCSVWIKKSANEHRWQHGGLHYLRCLHNGSCLTSIIFLSDSRMWWTLEKIV
jgi:hypothetical protein